jgi:hypothetical protein
MKKPKKQKSMLAELEDAMNFVVGDLIQEGVQIVDLTTGQIVQDTND